MTIYLVRHGTTNHTEAGTLADATEQLNDRGRQEALTATLQLELLLGGKTLDRIIASPRVRTQQTAAIIANHIGFSKAAIEIDARLMERDCSPFAGQPVRAVFSRPDTELVAEGMESLASVRLRTQMLYKELLDTTQPVLLVSHSTNVQPLYMASREALGQSSDTLPQLASDDILELTKV